MDSSDKEERTTPVVPSPAMSSGLLPLSSGADLSDMAGSMSVSNQPLFLPSRSPSLPPPPDSLILPAARGQSHPPPVYRQPSPPPVLAPPIRRPPIRTYARPPPAYSPAPSYSGLASSPPVIHTICPLCSTLPSVPLVAGPSGTC